MSELAGSDDTLALREPLRVDADVILLDIEGTLSPIAFVRDVLFAYSRERLAFYLDRHRDDPIVADILAEASRLAGGGDPVVALRDWQDRDEKIPPLKMLQGLIWEDGYKSGAFRSPLYPDAFAALSRWHSAGLPLYIYSSGSTKAQLLFFAHSKQGDLRGLFSDHFDTGIGAKTEAAAYVRIAERIGMPPDRIAFFSDNVKELEAARSVGVAVVHVVKDDTAPAAGVPEISDFEQVEIIREAR